MEAQCGNQGPALSEGRRGAACCPARGCAFLLVYSCVWLLVAGKTRVVGITKVGMGPLMCYRWAWG